MIDTHITMYFCKKVAYFKRRWGLYNWGFNTLAKWCALYSFLPSLFLPSKKILHAYMSQYYLPNWQYISRQWLLPSWWRLSSKKNQIKFCKRADVALCCWSPWWLWLWLSSWCQATCNQLLVIYIFPFSFLLRSLTIFFSSLVTIFPVSIFHSNLFFWRYESQRVEFIGWSCWWWLSPSPSQARSVTTAPL